MRPPRERAKLLTLILFAALATGFGLRLAPILGEDNHILQHFPSEDGYLMLTIARNIAIGNGMSVSGGVIPTNGTQPLTTFEWALCFWMSDGDKVLGVRYTLYLQLATSVLTALLMYLLGRRLLSNRPHGKTVAAVATSLWYASPLSIPHSMNCLESGNYAAVTLAVFLLFAPAATPGAARWGWAKTVGAGVLLGTAFLIRNDAVFLIAAACITFLTLCGERGLPGMRTRLARTLVMGTTSIAIASPWLVYNYSQFGSIMPISGQAESIEAAFGSNMGIVASILAEYVAVFAPCPAALHGHLVTELVCLAGLITFGVALRRSSKEGAHEERAAALMTAIFGLSLVAFYGFFFGSPYFVTRYFFPLSPLLALFTVSEIFSLHARCLSSGGWRAPALRLGLPVAAAAVVVGTNIRQHRQMQRHMHFQCVEWVAENVGEETWIGAVQTGTIGFFHDRTINLDGKVNPYALEHRKARTVPNYVADSEITYIVDWVRVGRSLIKQPPLNTTFDIIVEDESENLSVLRRKS